MFSRHVTKQISAYCHGELSSEDSKQFAEHIISCVKCRTKFEEIKLGIKLAEQLPQLSAPEHLWREIEPVLDSNNEVPAHALTDSQTPHTRPLFAYAAAAAAVLLTGAGFLWFYSNRPPASIPAQPSGSLITMARTSWRVKRLDGTPRIESQRISDSGLLGIGEVLETDGRSRAQISVGSIGNVEIDQNTRVKLLATEPTEHRLELARGKMSARIWAPPRLFFVDTPSAVAADMGCAYTLEVDEHGSSQLLVTSGWVALQWENRESIVPAGAACETRKGVGPGTPYFVDATPAFREALRNVDLYPDGSTKHAAFKSGALTSVLEQARQRDTLTLWHLLPRVNGDDRARVYDKLALLAPPPTGVTREGVLQLHEKMLEAWRQSLEPEWVGSGKGLFPKDAGKLKNPLSPKMKYMAPK